ncbi:MAG: type II toxin-antitoxin system RelE/ParE family toxin [Bacteroidetes bacterium]|nr:type II toxin-antitoxin system RelE/ParE family toxin [Bacteroidota bacterium]
MGWILVLEFLGYFKGAKKWKIKKLQRNLKDFHSVRINDQWRIIFKWISNNAIIDVAIKDYH